MAGPEFAAGFEALKAHAMRRMTALMCAEGLWWRRHRRLICDALTVEGWEVVRRSPSARTGA